MAAGQLSLTRRALLAGACAAPLAGGGAEEFQFLRPEELEELFRRGWIPRAGG